MAIYHGDTFDHQGYTFHVETTPDDSVREPWSEFDGHGIVSEWTTRAKKPGERVLCEDGFSRAGKSRRYYDVQATIRTFAKRDNWGCSTPGHSHPTAKERAACAVDRDYEYLRRFCAGDWQYLVVAVTRLNDDDMPEGETEYLGGVESSDSAYVETIARELADQIIATIEVESPDVQLSEN